MISFRLIADPGQLRDELDAALGVSMLSEAENNLMIGLARRFAAARKNIHLAGSGDSWAGRQYFMQTSPETNLILSTSWNEKALRALATFLKGEGYDLPGVLGPKESARIFAESWIRDAKIRFKQRIYLLEKLQSQPQVSGVFVPAATENWDLIREWAISFHREALASEGPMSEDSLNFFRLKINEGFLFLWKDGGNFKSFGGIAGLTANGGRIGPVYTPKEFRGQGYASALTWGISQKVLELGKSYGFLYTDLSNATSNSIYLKLGYRPILDVDQWTFDK